MQVRITITKDNGEEVELVQDVSVPEGDDLIGKVERQVQSIKESFLPLLSEQLVERHRLGFGGEKNQEEERP
jgi:hypothetical protein